MILGHIAPAPNDLFPKISVHPSRLANIPQELFNTILQYLDDGVDLICLALACRYFLSVLEKQIRDILASDAAPWVGERIILLGDYACDLPEGLLNESEQLELSHQKREDIDSDEEWEPSLYSFADDYYPKAERKKIVETVLPRLNGAEKIIFNQLCPDDSTTRENLPDQVWILRNLSKHEYVRADAIASLSPEHTSQGPFLEPVGFGQAIMTQVQWTSDGSGTIGPLKGRWAGDRFDITTLDTTISTCEDENKWEDVSSRVLKAVEKAGLY